MTGAQTEVDSHVDMPTQADAVEQAQPDVVAQATELFSDTAKWIFEAYDQDHDGLMTRKEFFTVRNPDHDPRCCPLNWPRILWTICSFFCRF